MANQWVAVEHAGQAEKRFAPSIHPVMTAIDKTGNGACSRGASYRGVEHAAA
jgi:hypothetical protein